MGCIYNIINLVTIPYSACSQNSEEPPFINKSKTVSPTTAENYHFNKWRSRVCVYYINLVVHHYYLIAQHHICIYIYIYIYIYIIIFELNTLSFLKKSETEIIPIAYRCSLLPTRL